MKTKIYKLFIINIIAIVLSMILIYHFTPSGYEGGALGKEYGNIFFLILVVLNLLYSLYYVIRINHSSEKISLLVLNLVVIFVTYTICATIHSIFKVGLW